MTRTKTEYSTGLDKTLIKVFGRNIPQTKDSLRFEMTQKGFRQKRIETKTETYIDDKYPVSDKQVNYAWDFLKATEQKRIPKQTKFNFTQDKYGNRASENLYYKGKTYRKGQFIPKSVIYGY